MNKLDVVKKNYNLFNTFRSTGFIVPILYLFIENKIGISLEDIVKIASFYLLLPFFIEVPLGYLGDKIGNKRIIQFGLIAQIISCVSLLFLTGNLAYHVYLIAIYVAGASYSGADKALVTPYFKDSTLFKNYMVKIGGEFYRNSIIFLIVGTASFQFHESLPIIIQIVAFLISLYAIGKIEETETRKHSEISPLKDFSVITKFLIQNPGYSSLGILLSTFGAAIALNQKVIQAQLISSLETIISVGSIWILGLVYSLGNFISWKGAKFFLGSGLKDKELPIQLMIISMIGIISFLMMTSTFSVIIGTGFLVVNIFKSLFRPILGAELSIQFPIASLRASALSVISVLGALISSCIHYNLAPKFINPSEGNTILVIIISVIAISCIAIIKKTNGNFLSLGKMSLTGKENIIHFFKERKTFIQIYPDDIRKDHFEKLEKLKNMNIYPHVMKFVDESSNKILCEYIESGELIYKEDHFQKIQLFLSSRRDYDHIGCCAQVPEAKDIFGEKISANLFTKITDVQYWGNIHGDLHPSNLLWDKDHLVAIDWDLAGEGYIWFDYLTLLTHPWTKISLEERILLFKTRFSNFSDCEIKQLFDAFRNFKTEQLESFSLVDFSLKDLVAAYREKWSY